MGDDPTRTYYAIGDVHGEDLRLGLLHDFIFEELGRAGVPATIVHLGDYVDRGPESRGVVARVMALPQRAAREARKGAPSDIGVVALRGNHEEMMLNAYDDSEPLSMSHWRMNGGDQTINSYLRSRGGQEDWRDAVDREHVKWLRKLPTLWRDEERKIAFVHAGIDPKTFPECSDEVRIWTRSQIFFNPELWPDRTELEDWLIVHGHTPTEDFEPEVLEQRINIDTGAVYGGPLTCAVLAPDAPARFLRA
jgi:serine/threonine protein phosphatase 1